jgi:hypothetical protein
MVEVLISASKSVKHLEQVVFVQLLHNNGHYCVSANILRVKYRKIKYLNNFID